MRTSGRRTRIGLAAGLMLVTGSAVAVVATSESVSAATDLVTVVSGQQTLAPSTAIAVNMDCPSGYNAVSGGIDSSEGDHTELVPILSSPVSAAHALPAAGSTLGPLPSWQVIAFNPDSMNHFFTGSVTCAPAAGGPVGPLTVVTAGVVTVSSGATSRSTALCPAADEIAGGGFVNGAYNPAFPPVLAASSPEQSGTPLRSLANGPNSAGTGWDVQKTQPPGGGTTFLSVAVCANQAGLSHTTMQVTITSIAATTTQDFQIGCPAGTEATGGGVDTGSVPQILTTSPLFGGASMSGQTAGPHGEVTGWESSLTNFSASILPLGIGVVCVSSPAPPPTTTTVPSGKTVTRLSGADRIATAIAVSQSSFPTAGSAHVVVLARDDAFPDALSGGPLAVAKTGPLLLTPTDSLDGRTQAEIIRVLPTGGTVYVLGGELALGPAIDSSLSAAGFAEVREAGVDRFETATKVADAIGSPTKVLEATGENFPDALSAGAAAGHIGGAVLLTNDTVQAPETATWLAAHPGVTRYAIGGQAAAADPAASAVFGADRYATATQVAALFFASPTVVAAALGTNFPDALSGGAHAGAKGAPLVLVQGSAPLPATTQSYLMSVHASVLAGFLYGGTSVVGEDVRTAIASAIA